MARRKKGNAVHGWLILDKPINMTSTQAVGAVRRAFNAQKAGHSGTLDPLATGILPIALGEATKTVSFAVEGEKAYRFTVRWGAETETDDTEGAVSKSSDKRPARAEIEALLPRFHGEIMQVPPAYSAIKIDGARAYDLARDGETVVLEPRPVVIESLKLVDMPDEATSVFEARCGKGTYVRAIARDLGRLIGCYGHVIALRRTEVGPFDEARAISMDALLAAAQSDDPEAIAKLLLPVEAALADLPELLVSQSDAATLARGQTVLIRGRDAPILTGPAYATSKGRLIALGELAKGALHPTRVFNLGP
ncbi:tRNA pseudouridine(55) synthase TruB [Hyphomicrobium sp.]|uniref:tRNA pseudouridine(55) synthase TruB n=1 Tax=Hyphomicrobium sp. TaxID=82 RepID=UPI000FADBD64|nr:tRNA pseudouridine(55) synthase TruB [Hyphomicrobium sp.]RUP00093.1 MAG: tRNA pseudouridine(55) synthase TruB [Hyphomicrobium sp.]